MAGCSVRILLVDDDVEVQGILVRWLERAGFEVEAAGSFQEAMAALQRASFHLLLVDLSLPDESGIRLMQELNTRDKPPPVVIITGHPSVSTVAEGMQLGARNYLTKPVAPDEVVDAIRSVLTSEGVLIDSEENFVTELGQRLRTARLSANLTMRQVAERVGVTQAHISQIESGLSAPSMSTLFRLARAVRLRLADLFAGY